MSNTNPAKMDATEQRFSLIELDDWTAEDFGADPNSPSDTIDTEIAWPETATAAQAIEREIAIMRETAPATVAAVVPPDDFEIDWDVAAPSEPVPVGASVVADADAIVFPLASTSVEPAQISQSTPIGPIANEIPTTAPTREYRTATERADIRRRNGTPEPRRLSARESAERQAKAQREEAERAAQAALDGLIQLSLTGSGDFKHGCIVGRTTCGDRTYADMCAVATAAGVEMPKSRSIESIASKAVASLKARKLKVSTVRRGSEWAVHDLANTIEVGRSVGDTEVKATLVGDELQLEGPSDLCTIVRGAFEAARREATLDSAEITAWINGILSSWRAVPTCYGRWLPAAHVSKWLAFATALADAGCPIPRRPAGVMNYADIAEEVSRGLFAEIETMLSKIEKDRAQAQAKSKTGDLGATAAATALASIADARRKLDMFEPITGPLTEARATLAMVQADLESLTDDTSQRAQMMELA